MSTSSPTSVLRQLGLTLWLLALALPAFADGTAVRGPAQPNGDEEIEMATGGVIDLNAARTPVTTDVATAMVAFVSITSVHVDTDMGIVGGYAEFDMNTDQVVPIGTTVGSSATGVLALGPDSVFVSSMGSTPVDVTFQLAFDGTFTVVENLPTLLLTGNLNATVFSGLSGTIFQSQLIYELSKVNPTYDPVALFTGVQTPLGGSNVPFPGATVDIIGDTKDHLEAILQLTVPIVDGDTLLLSSIVFGIAGPEPGDGPLEDGLDIRASHGIVDFSSTGTLTIFVPEGVSLVGSDPLLANIVVTAPVPVPAAVWLFGSALGLLGWRHRQAA